MIKKIAVISLVAAMAGCVGGMGSACGGCISSTIEQEVEKRTGVDLGSGDVEDLEDYKLTDADVKKFIRDFPKLQKEFKDIDETMHGPMGSTPMGGMAANQKLNSKLRSMGWNPPEKFFVVAGSITQAYFYIVASGGLDEAMGDYGEQVKQMEQMLDNPNIPPAQKKQMREQMKEMEKAQKEHEKQMKQMRDDEVFQHNLKVVKPHKKELDKIFQ